MKLRFWGIGSFAVALAILGLMSSQQSSDRYYARHRSIDAARHVIYGCVAYRSDPQSGGKYPTSIDELLRPSFKGGPFLVDPEYAIRDGWGNRLRYTVVVNESGESEVYAWAEQSVNGKAHLFGAKGAADGTVTMFGLPE